MERLEENLECSTDFDEEEYRAILDRIIRANRDVVVLSIVEETPMCGIDLIKEIFFRYGVYLSQGLVYPILYTLEEDGALKARATKGNMRVKEYFVTQEGKEVVHKKKGAFIKALEDVLIFVKGDARDKE